MKWLLITVTIFLIFGTVAALGALAYGKAYNNKFFPGVTINQQSLKNLSVTETQYLWQNKIDDFIRQGLKYRFNAQEITIFPTLPATDPDASHELVNFELDKTINRAYLTGRQQGYTHNFGEQMLAAVFGKNIPLEFQLHLQEFLSILKNSLEKFTSPKQEARPKINDDLTVEILPEAVGTTFDYRKIMAESISRIAQLESEPIVLTLMVDKPTIKKEAVPDLVTDQLKDRLKAGPLTLIYENKKWTVLPSDFKDWFNFIKEDQQVSLSLNDAAVLSYLGKIAKEINQPTLNAKFNILNGRVVEFQGSQDGLELDLEKTLEKIKQDYLKDSQYKIELTIKAAKARVTTGGLNNLGIAEIIGSGHSSFKGSPKNRRHNIKTGASSLNGILIKPGETFSLINALGEIDSERGYLPELVIKGDKTIPEFGGGLCQIGTTVFRAAIASGLPITERHNHSYRVVYYEPAGKDATIYNPRPDLKFINDTPNHILIQSRIEGDDLYFDFWGTKDGRLVSQSDSVIYNIKPAGPVINIETEELKPGKKNCTETAHAGADAYFDYEVTYPNGETKKERFSSHYIPWPAKCLIGKEPTAPTSTPAVVQ